MITEEIKEIKCMYNGLKINKKLYKGYWYRHFHLETKDTRTIGIMEDLITFISQSDCPIPRNIIGLKVNNNSDVMRDYHDDDSINFEPTNTLYKDVLAAWQKQEDRRKYFNQKRQ